MDPNLPQMPDPRPKRNIIIITVIIIIIIILAAVLTYSPNFFKKTPQSVPQVIQPKPTIPTTIQLKANQGTVSSITKDKIIIASGSATFEFLIDSLTAFGTSKKRVSLSDVKVGQDVSVTITEGSNSARIILILK